MITKDTPDRIAKLGQTISDASEELESIFRDLVAEADAQMVAAAQAFIAEHSDSMHRPIVVSYGAAHKALLKASVAASNILELSKRATTLRGKCTWWAGLNGRGQQPSDIRMVCENASKATR